MHAIANFLALDIVNERLAEAERRSRLLRGAGPLPRVLPRGVLQRLASSISERRDAGPRRVDRSASPAM